LAERRGVSQKEAVMELVDKAGKEEPVEPKPGSFYDQTKELCGIYEGPRNFSTNQKYMFGNKKK